MNSTRCFPMSLVEHCLILLYSHSRKLPGCQLLLRAWELHKCNCFNKMSPELHHCRFFVSNCISIVNRNNSNIPSLCYSQIDNLLEKCTCYQKICSTIQVSGLLKKVWRRILISLDPLFLSICLRILRVFVLKYFVYLS